MDKYPLTGPKFNIWTKPRGELCTKPVRISRYKRHTNQKWRWCFYTILLKHRVLFLVVVNIVISDVGGPNPISMRPHHHTFDEPTSRNASSSGQPLAVKGFWRGETVMVCETRSTCPLTQMSCVYPIGNDLGNYRLSDCIPRLKRKNTVDNGNHERSRITFRNRTQLRRDSLVRSL